MRFLLAAINLNATDLNGVGNDFVAGVVHPTAIAGWGHAFERALKAYGFGASVSGTAVVIHEWSSVRGHPRFMPEPGEQAASIRDEIYYRARLSLIVSMSLTDGTVPDGIDPDDPAAVTAGLKTVLQDHLLNSRLAGSGLHAPISATKPASRPAVECVEEGEIRHLLRRIPTGWLLIDRSDLMNTEEGTTTDLVDRVLDAVDWRPVENGGPRKRVLEGGGFIVPIAVGYQAIEVPKERSTPRFPKGQHPHCFAETLTSLGEYVSLRRRARTDNPLEGGLWRHEADRERLTFYVSARGAIHNQA